MFDLIDDVESYPEFVPGCTGARVLERSAEQVRAELTVGSGMLKVTFSTRNLLHRPGLIEIQLDKGPLKSLHGRWRLTPVTAGAVAGCRVELDLTFEPHGALGLALGPLIERLGTSLVDAFVARARHEPAS